MLSTAHRLSKGIIAASVGIFCFLVGYNNIIDYGTNYQFVEHVLSMDTMEPWFAGKHLETRAIESSTLQVAGYAMIIAGELLAGIFGLLAAVFMIINCKSNCHRFHVGQGFFIASGTIAVLIWYFGFAVVGAEWFQMWANQWNGQMKAYAFATFIIMTLIYVIVPSPKEWEYR